MNNINCEQAYNLIRVFLREWHTTKNFRDKYHNVDDFFIKIEFNKYLMNFYDRKNKIEDMIRIAKSNYSQGITISRIFVSRLNERNANCLKLAESVERFAEEEYNKFEALSNTLDSDKTNKYTTPSVKSYFKGFLGIGTKSNYEKMTSSIPRCLYILMDKFAKAILLYEQTNMDSPSPDPDKVDLQYMNEQFDKVLIKRLEEILTNVYQELESSSEVVDVEEGVEVLDVEGGSRKHTRRQRSKHSEKSAKRSKKGKKIMKSYTRKRHIYVRKQNKRKNRSRK
jgi:hypothetical protein